MAFAQNEDMIGRRRLDLAAPRDLVDVVFERWITPQEADLDLMRPPLPSLVVLAGDPAVLVLVKPLFAPAPSALFSRQFLAHAAPRPVCSHHLHNLRRLTGGQRARNQRPPPFQPGHRAAPVPAEAAEGAEYSA